MKALIFDSGTLINLSMNGLLYIIEELKKISDIKFLITRDVRYEIIDRPVGIPRFEFGALNLKELIESKIIELPESLEISEEEIKSRTFHFMEIANKAVSSKGKNIQIVSNAEMSCLALSSILSEKGIDNIIAIDERTTRILSEKPENLEELMSKKLHKLVMLNKEHFEDFKNFKFIRSTEIVYVAFKKGILKIGDSRALEAALYATKYKGSSVSFEEIDVLKKL